MSSALNRHLPALLACLALPVWLAIFAPGLAISPAHAALARSNGQTVDLADTWNPHPDSADIVLPMPGGIGMVFRLVAVPAGGFLGDMIFRPGIVSTDEADRAYYDRPYTSAISAPFTLADLPASWLPAAMQAIRNIPGSRQDDSHEGVSPNLADPAPASSGTGDSGMADSGKIQAANSHFFYLIGKYEVSRQQWQAIMGLPADPESWQGLTRQAAGQTGQDHPGRPATGSVRSGPDAHSDAHPDRHPEDHPVGPSGEDAYTASQESLGPDPGIAITDLPQPDLRIAEMPAPPDANAARPVTEVSWFDAVEFSRRYTVWLLANHPEALPRFAGDARNTGYLRLPTESEWEYAARGGHKAGIQLLREDFFALPEGAKRSDYAVYRPENALRIPTGAAVIGSRKPNPLGLYDTAGNVAEMVMDCFRFSVGGRLHGSAGGFVRKGGSWFSGDSAILPGRREEIPFFLVSGPASARDMGLRLVISGTNTPGGARPAALHAEWKKAGEGPSIAASQARNPLEELDRLLVMTTDQTTRKNLLALRDSIKESNIMRERQLDLEAETIFGSGAYMIETIRNYYSRSAVLETQIAGLERERERSTGKDLEKLEQILDKARRSRQQLEISLNRSLAFYQTKVEDSASLDPDVVSAASANVARDYGGDGPFDQNMRRNLELFVGHVDAWRKGRAIPREKLKKEILERRFR